MDDHVYQLTKEGYQKLKIERDEAKKKLMGEIASRIKEARELGDLSENSEYEEAKNEQGKIDSRIKEIDYIIDHAEILEDVSTNNDEVNFGKKVKIKDYGMNKEKEFLIVTPQEANIKENKLSTDSPIGRALLGKKKGEVFHVKTLNGKMKKVKVIDIN